MYAPGPPTALFSILRAQLNRVDVESPKWKMTLSQKSSGQISVRIRGTPAPRKRKPNPFQHIRLQNQKFETHFAVFRTENGILAVVLLFRELKWRLETIPHVFWCIFVPPPQSSQIVFEISKIVILSMYVPTAPLTLSDHLPSIQNNFSGAVKIWVLSMVMNITSGFLKLKLTAKFRCRFTLLWIMALRVPWKPIWSSEHWTQDGGDEYNLANRITPFFQARDRASIFIRLHSWLWTPNRSKSTKKDQN